MKKFISLILALLLLFCSCDISDIEELDGEMSEENAAQPVDTSVFGVGIAKSESADPYTTKNKLNFELCGLICEPLFFLSPTFEATPVLCESYTYSEKTYVFTVKSGVTFSDGSKLTASDVEYSLRAAMEYGSFYATNLSVIESVSSSDRNSTVTVRLRYDNCRLPSLLDIPIIKSGTRDKMLPTGTGLYAPKDDMTALVARSNHHSGKKTKYSVISLVSVAGSDELLFEFDNHAVSLLTSDPTGASPLTPLGASQINNVPTTRMHYIGFNVRKKQLADKSVRAAISRAIDRESAAKNDFALMGVPSPLPIHPDAKSYPAGFAEAFAYDGTTRIELSSPLVLLVNSENPGKLAVCKRISENLTRLGAPCTVHALPFNEYAAALSRGDFDLYYAEVSLGADFDLSRILQGSLNYGGFYDAELSSLYSAYLAKDEAGESFFRAFCERTPFAPIMFKSTAMYTPQGFFEKATPTAQNPYHDFCNWISN